MKKNKLKPFLTDSVFILPALLLLNGIKQEAKAMIKSSAGKVLNGIKSTTIKIPNITNNNTGIKVSPSTLNAVKKHVNSNATTSNTTSSSLSLENIKPNKFTIPSITGGVTISSSSISNIKKSGLTGSITTTGSKSATLPNINTSTSSTSNLIGKSNSFLGTTTKRPAPQPPTSSSNLVNKVNNAGITTDPNLKSKRPAPQPPTSSSSLVNKVNNTETITDPSLKSKRPAPQPPTSSNKLTNTNSNKTDSNYETVPKPIFTPKDLNKPVAEHEQYENVIIINTDAGSLTIFKDQ